MAATIALAAPAVAQNYTITDLGALSSMGDTDSNATAINASGAVVGYSGVYDTSYANLGFYIQHAFLWTPSSNNGTTGTMSYLGGLPGDQCVDVGHSTGLSTPFPTYANDINSAGQVVGSSYTSDGTCPTLKIHGVLWKNGLATDLGVPPGYSGYSWSYATSINDTGQIVGYAQNSTSSTNIPDSNADAWLYNGSFHDIGFLPDPGLLPYLLNLAVPSKINSGGTLVGTSSIPSLTAFLGFVHTGTGPILATDAIGTLGGPNASATGINQAGLMVGASLTAGLASHAFWIDKFGQIHDLGTASKDPLSNSQAAAINNIANNTVGWSDVDPAQAWMSCQHAVMWQNAGNLIDLNSLLNRNADPPLAPPVGTPNVCSGYIPSTNTCATCWELINATGINDLGQIVGEGLLNGQRHAFLLTPPCINDGGDTDGDGLCDDWEKNGYTTADGVKVDLPAMGADPQHKDIFVQADYMVNPGGGCDLNGVCVFGHTHQPKPDAIAAVTAAFANAPVENPDGKTGITLHVDCGQDCIMNPLTGETWGDLSEAQSISPEITPLGSQNDPTCPPQDVDSNGSYCWTAFEQIKTANFSPSRAPIFHYMIFAHELNVYSTSTGLSEHISGKTRGNPESSFVVSLGSKPGEVGSSRQQAGTFMHELGHNLGLHHGGLDDVNFKPNYLSVMNYLFQFNGLVKNGSGGYMDYSIFPSIPDLNELVLYETVGLNGGAVLTNYGTSYYCPGGSPSSNPALDTGRRFVADANGPIDWDCNGQIQPATFGTFADINAAYDPNTGNFVYETLHSSEDWNHLIYTGGGIGAAGFGAFASTSTNSDPEIGVPDDSTQPFLVEVVSPGVAQVLPGTSLNLTFTINNTGQQQDTYTLSPSTQYNWWNTSGIPSTVTLAGGASQQVIVPVTVPGNICFAPGARAKFTIQAASQTYPSIADSAVAVLIVVSNPGSVQVPAVNGLSQAQAQAAIVSAGLVVGTVTTQSSSAVPAGTVISQTPGSCGLVAPGTAISIVVSSGPELIAVPNVVGDAQAAAVATISGAGLTPGSITAVPSSTTPAGNVISQNPPVGTQVTPGSPISLTVASIQLDVVPNVVGSPIAAAITAIDEAGFTLGVTSGTYSATVPAGTVLSQFPSAGGMALPGSPVSAVVSSGSSSYGVVPNVLGDTGSAATSAILTAGFTVGSVALSSSTTVPKGDVIGQNPLAGVTTYTGAPVYLNMSAGPQPYVVPNVYGLPQAAATSAITAAGLTLGTVTPYAWTLVPPGDAFGQSPVAGTYVSAGSPVNIYVATAPATDVVPDLSTTSYVNAALDITQAGLTPGTFTLQSSPTVSQGYIISQSPAAGTSVAAGSPVDVVYSAGSKVITVPKVVGESQTAASGDILYAFLYVAVTRQPSTTVPDGEVISQSPAAGSPVILNSIVTIVVSSGDPVTATVPNVVGMTGSGAEQALFAAGFAVGSISTQPSTTATGVISQTPGAGTIAPWDTSVSLVFSSGPPVKVTVPSLVGLTQTAAIAAIDSVNSGSLAWTMTTQSSQTVPTGNVISQNPPAGVTLLGKCSPRPGWSSRGVCAMIAHDGVGRMGVGNRYDECGPDGDANPCQA